MDVNSRCELRDVSTHCFLDLPGSQDQLWTIGLTVSEELSGCTPECVYSSNLVVVFFSLHTKHDGHWVTPHPDLPLILNGEELYVTALLSHGSVLMVGGHTLTYRISMDMCAASTTEQTKALEVSMAAPPPKPKRSNTAGDIGDTNNQLTLVDDIIISPMVTTTVFDGTLKMPTHVLKAQYDPDNKEDNLEKSMEIFISLKKSVINNDIELLSHIETPDQVVGVCMSYIVQFCLSNGLALSSREVDVLCKIISNVWGLQPQSLFEFLGNMKTKEIISEHDVNPFLKLLSDLLLWSMDTENTSEVCLKVIAHLSEEPQICIKITKHSIIALISACMSVYPNNVLIQTLTCRVYANVLEEWKPSCRCPIREAAVDFIVRAIELHNNERPFLRSAFRALAALLKKQDLQRSTYQLNCTSVLDHIERNALPVVQKMVKSHDDDVSISQYCSEIIDFYATRTSQNQEHHDLSGYESDNSGAHYDNIKLSDNSTEEGSYKEALETMTSIDSTTDDYIVIISGENEQNNDTSKSKETQVATVQGNTLPCNTIRIQSTTVKGSTSPGSITDKQINKDDGVNINGNMAQTHLIDNEIYEETVIQSSTTKHITNVVLSGSHSETGSMYEELGQVTHVNNITATDSCSPEQSITSSKENTLQASVSLQKPPIKADTVQNEPIKKSTQLKKKIGKYFSKLKPKGRKNKKSVDLPRLKDGPSFLENPNHYVQFDQFDNSIDMAYSYGGEGRQFTGNSIHSEVGTSQEYENTDVTNVVGQTTISKTEVFGTDNQSETDSNGSAFKLGEIPESDSDSIASEFRLPSNAFRSTHNSSSDGFSNHTPSISNGSSSGYLDNQSQCSKNDYFTQNSLSIDNVSAKQDKETSFSIGDRSLNTRRNSQISIYNSYNSSKSSSRQSLNSNSGSTFGHTPVRKLSTGTISITSQSSTTSSNCARSRDHNAHTLPNTRSEYAEHIQKSMQARTGTKSAWVSALKRIYEKPNKGTPVSKGLSSKSCTNLSKIGKRYSLVENPAYSTENNPANQTSLSISICKSMENLMNTSTTSIDEEDEQCVSQSYQVNEENIEGTNQREKVRLSKFEELKLKNKRTRLDRFPWHSEKPAQ